MSLLALFVLPVGAFQFLQAFFPNTTEQQLSLLTVTSPFSAAFSVEAPSGGDGMSGMGSSDAGTRGLLLPGIDQPVWGRLPHALAGVLPGTLRDHLPGVPLAVVARRERGLSRRGARLGQPSADQGQDRRLLGRERSSNRP